MKIFDTIVNRILYEHQFPDIKEAVMPAPPPPERKPNDNVNPFDYSGGECSEQIKELFAIARYQLLKRFELLAHIVARMTTICDKSIPSMGVDNWGTLYYNPGFLQAMSSEERIGVLCHESMHIITWTFKRKSPREHKLWNVATDLIINYELISRGVTLPIGGLIPEKDGTFSSSGAFGQRFKKIKLDLKDSVTQKIKSAEQLYDDLLKFEDKEYLDFLKDLQKKMDDHIITESPPPTGPQPPPPPAPEGWIPIVGEPVYNSDTEEYGVVEKIYTTKKIDKHGKPIPSTDVKKISRSEAIDLAIKRSQVKAMI